MRNLGVFIVLTFLVLSAAAMAEDAAVPAEDAADGPREVVLSLDDVTRIGLAHNVDVRLAVYDVLIARTGVESARSAFDTFLEGEILYRNDEKQRTTTILGTRDTNNDYNVAVSKILPTGTDLRVDFTNNRNVTNAPFATSRVSHESAAGVHVTQSIGRNFFGLIDRAQVTLAEMAIEVERFSSLDRIETQLVEIQKAYWQLVLAYARRNLFGDMLARAEEFYDLQKEKLDDGLVETPDVLAAEANYRRRLNDVVRVGYELENRISTLKILLDLDTDLGDIRAAESLALPESVEFPEQSLRIAAHFRKDYQRLKQELEAGHVQVSVADNAAWPEINLQASLIRNGLGDHFKQAIEEAADDRHDEIFLGIRFEMPLENRKAESELERAKLEKAKLLIRIKQLEREIILGVTDAVRHVNMLKTVAENATAIVSVEQQKLDAEMQRYQYGRSNTDMIIRFQDDLLEAQLQQAQAYYDYLLSRVDLRKAEGAILDHYWPGI